MTKIEYWDMGDNIFIKTSKNGTIESSRKIPKSECESTILNKFNGKTYFVDEFDETAKKETKEPILAVTTPDTIESNIIVTSPNAGTIVANTTDVSIKEKSKVKEESKIEVKKPKTNIKTKSDKKYDFVNSPAHYNGHIIKTKTGQFEYETIQYLESLVKRLEKDLYADESGSVYCAAKYMDRIGGGKPDGNKTVREKIAEDCQKIGWYMNHCAELIKKNGFEDKSKK